MILFNLAVQIVVQVVVLFIFLLYIYVCVTNCSYQPELMILMIINEVYQVYSKSVSVTTFHMHANSNYLTI